MGRPAGAEYQFDDEPHGLRRNLSRLSRQRRQRRHPGQRGNQRRARHRQPVAEPAAVRRGIPDQLRSWDFKGSLLEDTLQARLAVFYMDRDDQQVKGSLVHRPRPTAAPPLSTTPATRPAATTTAWNWNWTGWPADSLTLFANIGLLQTEFDQYIDADGNDLSGGTRPRRPATSTPSAATMSSARVSTFAWMSRAGTVPIFPTATT